VTDLVLPRDGERRVHGNASFMPAYFERAVSEAMREKPAWRSSTAIPDQAGRT
jgi:hypothetical protein